jgi:hypothetical protein
MLVSPVGVGREIRQSINEHEAALIAHLNKRCPVVPHVSGN